MCKLAVMIIWGFAGSLNHRWPASTIINPIRFSRRFLRSWSVDVVGVLHNTSFASRIRCTPWIPAYLTGIFDWDRHFTIRTAFCQNSKVFPIFGNFGNYSLQIHLERLALASAGRSACQGTASVCPAKFLGPLFSRYKT